MKINCITYADNTWVTLWLVTLVTLPTTMLQVYKTTKKSCERKRKKPHVTLWLANVTNNNVTQVLPDYCYLTQKYKHKYQTA